jgi:hypothetical protein
LLRLFLGVANYQSGREARGRNQVLEAARFSEKPAAIPGPCQRQAWTNVHVMRTEAEDLFRQTLNCP